MKHETGKIQFVKRNQFISKRTKHKGLFINRSIRIKPRLQRMSPEKGEDTRIHQDLSTTINGPYITQISRRAYRDKIDVSLSKHRFDR